MSNILPTTQQIELLPTIQLMQSVQTKKHIYSLEREKNDRYERISILYYVLSHFFFLLLFDYIIPTLHTLSSLIINITIYNFIVIIIFHFNIF